MLKIIKISVLILVLICVLQVVYTYVITGIAQLVFPYQANGSLLYVDGKLVGSELIGQEFTSPGYFHGRPSAREYNTLDSGGSNLGPTSAKLMEQVKERVERVRKENGLAPGTTVPPDMVLTSGSGLDPHISPENAFLQVGRVAKVRNLAEAEVRVLVEKYVEQPQLGVLGATKVNVLKLNIALDELANAHK
jgi:K+-transporting ATPase ATPase C chain